MSCTTIYHTMLIRLYIVLGELLERPQVVSAASFSRADGLVYYCPQYQV